MNKNKLIPELRFPEFANEGEWEEKKLGEVAEINPRISQLPHEFVYIDLESVSGGVLLQKKIIKLENAPSRAQRLLQENDVIFQTVRPYQKNNFYYTKSDNYHYVASTGYAQLRAFESSMFLFQLIHTDSFVADVLAKCTGSSYPAINSSDLSQIKIQIPPSPPEQQKIAACLSSLDELITAESQKLEELKNHKKGLMQNLFPQEGEKVPKLRFPEFVNDAEWEEKELSEIAIRVTEKVGTRKLTTVSISAGLGFVSQAEKFSRDISGQQYKNYIVLNEGEFSYNKGYSKKFPQGSIYKLKEFKVAAVPDAFISFRFKPDFVGDFFQGYFDNNRHGRQLKQFITSGARMDGLLNINAKDFFSIVLPTPPSKSEQQKIADCLSSLDAIITAQAEKIEQLKLHKKGLMQRLFPKIEP